YGLRGIAMRSLKRSVGSLLWATAGDYVPAASEDRWRAIMGEIAASSRQAYKETVFDRAEFNTYFRAATPIDVIERLGMGSRPGTGKHVYGRNEPRANPWLFAWTQNRAFLPGWFGLGTGLEHAARTHGVDALRRMYDELNFFRVLINDAEVVLGKSDLTVSERYSRLAGPLHEMFFPVIRDEYERCARLVMDLTEQGELLQRARTLRRAIRLRNPYVDPMSLLQVDLLERWRRSGRLDDSVLQPLVVSIYGIAHGMQTTG
ncbi:MAG: phosphoenolpyruvate carboxylase, partial [Rhodospirillaceae bacterium]|nr:phosphoenolpyruvate carboxylase [Rhodospirillaceae bacterium]